MPLFGPDTVNQGAPYEQPKSAQPQGQPVPVNIKLVGPPSAAALAGAPAPHEDAKHFMGMPTLKVKPEGAQ